MRERRFLGTTARRVVYAILITALIPLVSAVLIARTIIARVSATAFQPEFGAHLDQSLGVYADLAKAIKQQMRAEAEAIAASEALRAAAVARDSARLDAELGRVFVAHPSLVELRLVTCPGAPLAGRTREKPVDPATERTLNVRRVLGPGAEGDCLEGRPDEPIALAATFATPRARLDELEGMQAFVQAYHQIERGRREEYVDQTYANVFAALLGGTLLLAVAAGVLVVRPVTRRIAKLSAATRPVAEGDLSVRVALEGDDEVADLGRAFDRMLEELSKSRARVEFLKRMGEWQKMARRLAHEIKNPLTPIQLAVEECHRRYQGEDVEYKRIVQTTLEVVEEEVGSLRRLVSEFSSFARLPRAELLEGDLGEFLRDQAAHIEAHEGEEGDDRALFAGVDVTFTVPADPMPAVLDTEMLHRVLTNVIRNAAQAIRDAKAAQKKKDRGRVQVAASVEGEQFVVTIDDDGPGIPPDVAEVMFDPYVTTKRDGTGLGLTIVKKIVMDHGGSIEAGIGTLGGARIKVTLPRAGSAAARAALEKSESGPESARPVESTRWPAQGR
ncbi:Nitrogen regulation protein ntrY [Minicystis rosea]|nr:Nitrogen regulation protein ntrY [Minicystis rosea]